MYDTWKSTRHQITEIPAGIRVVAETGVVITFKPGVIRMDRGLPEWNLHGGDQILTYTYRGEGYAAVWFKQKFYSDFDISFAKWPDRSGCGGEHCAAAFTAAADSVWWARVRLKSGETGWVNMNKSTFDGTDMLGGP